MLEQAPIPFVLNVVTNEGLKVVVLFIGTHTSSMPHGLGCPLGSGLCIYIVSLTCHMSMFLGHWWVHNSSALHGLGSTLGWGLLCMVSLVACHSCLFDHWYSLGCWKAQGLHWVCALLCILSLSLSCHMCFLLIGGTHLIGERVLLCIISLVCLCLSLRCHMCFLLIGITHLQCIAWPTISIGGGFFYV